MSLPEKFIIRGDDALHLVECRTGEANAPRFSDLFESRCYIHTITEDVLLLNDYVAEIDAHAKPDPSLFGQVDVAVDLRLLDLDGTADGIHDTCKFRQETVARVLYCATPMLLDLRIDQVA